MFAEEHKRHILDLFRILSEERIYLQLAKSKLFCKYVRYLGMVCGNDMLLEDPAKIRSIVKMPAPKESQTQVRGFIGMASFWRKFIPDFAGIIYPLNSLLLKGVNVKTSWGPQHDAAVYNIKKALISYPVLRHFDPGKPAFVYTDASKVAIGGFLGQKDDDGNIYVISYVSRTLHGAEHNYSVQELECLAIVFAVQKFRHFVLCSKFTLRCSTDHSSLVFLSRPSEASGRIARWSMIMSEFDYVVEWIKGADNFTPDQLSRLITIPDASWTPLADGHDLDDDSAHPFLHIACAGNLPGDKFLVPGLRNCLENAITQGPILNTVEDREWAPVEHSLNSAVGCYNVNWSELKLQSIHSVQHEEKLHYAMPQYKLDNKLLKFTAEDYLDCDEFQVVYGMLQKQASHAATCLAVLRDGKDTDVTDSELFSDAVATQVLSDNPELKKKISESSENKILPKALVDAAIKKQGDALLPPAHTPRVNSLLDFWAPEEKKCLSLYRVCFIDNGFLYRVVDGKELLCVPNTKKNGESVRYSVFEHFHDEPMAGHRGVVQTYAAMRRRLYWKYMDQDIRRFIKSCTCCQMNKKSRRQPTGLRAALQIPNEPMESYNIDFLTDLPPATDQKFDMAMIVLDRFSQRLFVLPTRKTATGEMCAELFHDEITCRAVRGCPREVISDRDVRFTSNSKMKKTFWEGFQRRLGTCTRFSSARTQSTNGAVERQIAVIIEVLMCYLNYDQTNWVGILPHLIFAINNSPSKALGGVTPIFAETGINPKMPMDLQSALDRPGVSNDDASVSSRVQKLKDLRGLLRDSIKRARADVAKYANNGRRELDPKITEGALVWLSLDGIALPEFNLRRHAKWNPLWYGPFLVLRRPTQNSATLSLPPDLKIHDTFHVSQLKAFEEGDFKGADKRRQLPAQLTKDLEYEVSRILDHDFKFGIQFYLVAFKGYSEVYDQQWLSRDALMENAAKTVLNYEKKHRISADEPVSKKVRRRKSTR